MIIVDSLLIGGIKFVLGKLIEAAEAEQSDDSGLREELLATQMRLELGEITEKEYLAREAELLAGIRDIRARTRGPSAAPGAFKVTGVEATFEGDEHESPDAPER